MFSSSVFIKLSSPRFFTFVCYLHLKQSFYFSSTENSSLNGRKTLSLNTVKIYRSRSSYSKINSLVFGRNVSSGFINF